MIQLTHPQTATFIQIILIALPIIDNNVEEIMADHPVIAIVDDDDGVRSSVSSLIRSAGYKVRTYDSALAFLSTDPSSDPDCMIADIQMPFVTGEQLQDRLKAAGRIFPIIFMTAHPNDEIRFRVMAAGAVDFLIKPADGDIILQRIQNAVTR